jgi:hypothetical protein
MEPKGQVCPPAAGKDRKKKSVIKFFEKRGFYKFWVRFRVSVEVFPLTHYFKFHFPIPDPNRFQYISYDVFDASYPVHIDNAFVYVSNAASNKGP